jgi:hypothetical protein
MEAKDAIQKILDENNQLLNENKMLKEKLVKCSNRYNHFLNLLTKIRDIDIEKREEVLINAINLEENLFRHLE